ncbi:hypothetical protein GJ496_000535, partial [Pomphorhynchus laevis]
NFRLFLVEFRLFLVVNSQHWWNSRPFANLHLYEVVYVLRLYDPLMAACTNENLGKKDTKMTSPKGYSKPCR